MILCGGSGTRLGALTVQTPKPLLPVSGRPFLDVLLLELGRHKIEEIIFLAAFEFEQISDYARDNPIARRFGMKLKVSIEPERAGTGGAVHHARSLADHEFLLLNGNSWFDINLLSLPDPDSLTSTDVTIAIREIEDASRYGVVEVAGERITEFLERPRQPGPGLVNAGVYRVSDRIFSALEPKCSFERDTLPKLAAQNRLSAVARQGYFIDIGVGETYARAQAEIPAQQNRRAIFFDRDGVLNHDHGYVGQIDRFEWIDGSRDAIRALNDQGYLVFIVTNQSGVARGYYTEDDVVRLHAHIDGELRIGGAHFDDMRYCPYHTAGTVERYRIAHPWRKPQPGMLIDLLANWNVDRAGSAMIGDQPTDMAAAAAAGLRGHHFQGGNLLHFIRAAGII